MTSNIFYQWASINFNKDKETFAVAVIIIKKLLTTQFSMNIKSSATEESVMLSSRISLIMPIE